MDYKEEFEVVTTSDGSSTLSITLACATVKEHYDRTTTAHSTVASDPAEVCSTGLRVYEGAQVLASFMYRYGVGLVIPLTTPATAAPETATAATSRSNNETDRSASANDNYSSFSKTPRTLPITSVVELGCGCGLVGFTLAAALRASTEIPVTAQISGSLNSNSQSSSVSLVFTDASVDCLSLVRRSGRLAGRFVRDLDISSHGILDDSNASTSSSDVYLSTFRLAWSDAGVQALQKLLAPLSDGVAAAQLVFGSDLMYYRVDINVLVHTAKLLLLPSTSSTNLSASKGLIVFAHFMRIPDGQRKLAAVARESQNMAIVSVPLTAFLDNKTIHSRGWNGIELVILAPKTSVCADTHCGSLEKKHEDVCYIKTLLRKRAAEWEGTLTSTAATRVAAAVRQARALSDVLQPYPFSNRGFNEESALTGEGAAVELAEENALLNLFL